MIFSRPEEINRYGSYQAGSGPDLFKLAQKALTGPLPTTLKTIVNKSQGYSRAYPGELHSMHRVGKNKKKLVFGSYLGPGTNVETRIRKNVKPVSRADEIALQHDLLFATATSPGDLRPADERAISNWRQAEAEGEPRFNTRPGIMGLEKKNRLEDSGQWPKDKFFNPVPRSKRRFHQRAQKKLKELEQKGYGALPADRITAELFQTGKNIFKKGKRVYKKGRKLAPSIIPRIISKDLIPLIGRELKKAFPRVSRMMGSGKAFNQRILNIIKKQMGSGFSLDRFFANMKNILPPIAMELLPRIIKMVTKKISGGSIISLSTKLLPVLIPIIGGVLKRALKSRTGGAFGPAGSGLRLAGQGSIMKGIKKFAKILQTGIIPTGSKIAKPIHRVLMRGQKYNIPSIVVNKFLPKIVELISKHVPLLRQPGSGFKTSIVKKLQQKLKKQYGGFAISTSVLLSALATAGLPIAATVASTVGPKLVKLISKKIFGSGKGGALKMRNMMRELKKLLAVLLNPVGGGLRLAGQGLKSLIRKAGRNFIKTFIIVARQSPKIAKEVVPIVWPLIKEYGPTVFKNVAVPLIKGALTRS